MVNFIERFLQVLSALITIFSPLVSIPPSVTGNIDKTIKVNYLIDLSIITSSLQQSDLFIKIILFFIAEASNAYFFSLLYNGIHRRFKGKTHDLMLLFIVIVLTASISTLFLLTILFNNNIQTIWQGIGFTILFAISLLITIIFFSYEHAIYDNNQRDPLKKLASKFRNMNKKSIWLMVLMYGFFFVLVWIKHWS